MAVHIEKIQQNTNLWVPELIMQALVKVMEDTLETLFASLNQG